MYQINKVEEQNSLKIVDNVFERGKKFVVLSQEVRSYGVRLFSILKLIYSKDN
jgi:hypothetical protein